jgi:hypothetical protein
MNRLVTLLVAMSLVAPPLLEARHAGRVHHVACPVDGQFEDARDESAETPHSHAIGNVLPSGVASEHSHHACEAVPAGRQRVALGGVSPPVAPVVPREIALAPTDEPRPSAVELYRVAPKLSPPLQG